MAEFDGTSEVGSACESEGAGKGGSEREGDGGVGSGIPAGLPRMLRRVVGTGEAVNLMLTGETDGQGTGVRGAVAVVVGIAVMGEGTTPVFKPLVL